MGRFVNTGSIQSQFLSCGPWRPELTTRGPSRYASCPQGTSATQKKNRLRDILGHFGLLAYDTQLDVSFQIHYVA